MSGGPDARSEPDAANDFVPVHVLAAAGPHLRPLVSGWDRLLAVLSRLGGIGLLCLAVMIATDVMFRWLFGRPILGVFEFSEILLLLTTFLVIARVQFTGQHLRIDILSSRATGRLAGGLSLLDCLAGLAFFGILLWTSAIDWWEALHRGYLGRGMLQIPTAIPLGFLLLGTGLMVVTLLLLLLVALRRSVQGDAGRHPNGQ